MGGPDGVSVSPGGGGGRARFTEPEVALAGGGVPFLSAAPATDAAAIAITASARSHLLDIGARAPIAPPAWIHRRHARGRFRAISASSATTAISAGLPPPAALHPNAPAFP